MVSLRKKNYDKPFSERLTRRVSKIATTDLASWAEQSLNEINRCLSKFESTREKFFLDEALTGAEALHAVVSELHKRNSI